MCERLSSSAIKITLHEAGNRISLDKDQELLLYRIAQEAITNAIRHSNASVIDVHYQWGNQSLTLLIMDDGLGFDFPTINNQVAGRHGLGLYNMENRVDLLCGELSFNKNNPSGTVVSVKLPLAS
jgi:signal transduction histidine kinase